MIWFHHQTSLEIRSADPMLIDLLHRHFCRTGTMKLGTNELSFSACQITNTHLNIDRAAIRMISPAVAYVTDDQRHTVFSAG